MKRFIQGLGVGILATTLIFTVSYYTVGNNKMSDKEIISKAKKLGMVQVTEAPLFNDNSNNEQQNNEQQNNEQQNNEQQNNEQQNNEQTVQDNVVTEEQNGDVINQNLNNNNEESTENNTAGDSDVTLQNPVADDASSVPEQADENDDGTISVTISEGEGASTVAFRLQKLGIVSSATDFDKYLRNNSKSHVIQIGTFNLKPGMDYEEISDIISGK